MTQPSAVRERRERYTEVLRAIDELKEFTTKDVQLRCVEAKAAFITRMLKQLHREGFLQSRGGLADDAYVWTGLKASFVDEDWISRQLEGNQVTQSPLDERPRERLLTLGASNLRTSELLAILIRSGRKGESAVEAGQRVANRFNERLDMLRTLSPVELKRSVVRSRRSPIVRSWPVSNLGGELPSLCSRMGSGSKSSAVPLPRSHIVRDIFRVWSKMPAKKSSIS